MIPQYILDLASDKDHTNHAQINELIEKFESLKHPDPYYRFSDDHQVFSRGQKIQDNITAEKQQIIVQIKSLLGE